MASHRVPVTALEHVWTPMLNRYVLLRPGTSDRQVWEALPDANHVPPATMAVPRTVLDLGANIGLVSAHYGLLWPYACALAVEMCAESAEVARMNAPAARPVTAAVAATAGYGYYDVRERHIGRRLAPRETIPAEHRRGVECIPLHGFGYHDFVKMDVEGAEWGILESLVSPPPFRHLLLSLHSRTNVPQDRNGPQELVDVASRLLLNLGCKVEQVGARQVFATS